jgi:uncharacterized protein YdeI (YjbR/CyaY-like superfamily)
MSAGFEVGRNVSPRSGPQRLRAPPPRASANAGLELLSHRGRDALRFGTVSAGSPRGGKVVFVAEGDQVLTVADAVGWSRWLSDHGGEGSSVWLVLAKKGTTEPTRLTYDEALEEAICHGWVDGQLAKGDDRTFRRKFAPRRTGSAWSKRNVDLAKRLIEEGRMRPSGLAAIDRARADGSWDGAYEGQATIQIPPDLASALATNREAEAMFGRLTATNRYAILYRVTTAQRSETRRRRIEQFVAMLARGETIHPQR